MIQIENIYVAVNKALISTFGYKVYGYEVKKGYKKPSFFVDIRSDTSNYINVNVTHETCTVRITYFQEKTDTMDNLKMLTGLKKLFHSKLDVSGRQLTISDVSHDYVGEDETYLQYSFDLEFYNENENGTPTEQYDIARTLYLDKEMR